MTKDPKADNPTLPTGMAAVATPLDVKRETGVIARPNPTSDLPGEREVTNGDLLVRIIGLADIYSAAKEISENNGAAIKILSTENRQIFSVLERLERSIGAENEKQDARTNNVLNDISASLMKLETNSDLQGQQLQSQNVQLGLMSKQMELQGQRIAELEKEGRQQNERLARLEQNFAGAGSGGAKGK